MPKYDVTLMDGRILPVISANEDLAKKQALHHETSRIVIATKRGQEITVPPSIPFSITKVKD